MMFNEFDSKLSAEQGDQVDQTIDEFETLFGVTLKSGPPTSASHRHTLETIDRVLPRPLFLYVRCYHT